MCPEGILLFVPALLRRSYAKQPTPQKYLRQPSELQTSFSLPSPIHQPLRPPNRSPQRLPLPFLLQPTLHPLPHPLHLSQTRHSPPSHRGIQQQPKNLPPNPLRPIPLKGLLQAV